MMIFNDIPQDSGFLSTQNGFKAVVDNGKKIMQVNRKQEWALNEIEIDAEDYKWLESWIKNLSTKAASHWLKTNINDRNDPDLKLASVIGTLLLLHAIHHTQAGTTQREKWPLPSKNIFPANVSSILFNEDDEPSEFYIRAIELAAKKLKIKTGASTCMKQWLHETINLQINPDASSPQTTLEPIARSGKINDELIEITNGNIPIEDLFSLFEPDAGAACVEKIAQTVLTKAQKKGISKRPWSLAELFPSDMDYVWLRIWIKKLDENTVRYCLRQSERFSWNGTEYPMQGAFGIALLLWVTEEARRKAAEGSLWNRVPQNAFRQEVRQVLFSQQNPTQILKDCIEIAARRFNLRHVFGIEGTQQWFNTVFLQFGFSKSGMESRLQDWLSGHTLTISIDTLLHEKTKSESFVQLWETLKDYRLRKISREETIERIQNSPWILLEWIPRIVKITEDRTKQNNFAASDVDHEVEHSLISGLQFHWNPPNDPYFSCRLSDINHLDLIEEIYKIKIDNQIIGELYRQPNGTYLSISASELKIFIVKSAIEIKIVDEADNVHASQVLQLWEDIEDITVFQLNNGKKIDDPYKQKMNPQSIYAVLVKADLKIEPQPRYWRDLSGYRLYYFPLGWNPRTQIMFDDSDNIQIWQPIIDQPTPIPPVASQITLQIENHHPDSLIHWGSTISLKINHPSEARVKFARYNGKKLAYNQLTSQSGRIGPLRVEPCNTKDDLEIKIILLHEGQLMTLVKKVPVNQVGTAKLSTVGWEVLNEEFTLELRDASKSRFKIKPPSIWNNKKTETNQWSLMEGELWVKKLSSRQGSIGTLGGWGAPLTVRFGPFNNDKDAMTIAHSVVDRGRIADIMFESDHTIVKLLTEITPNDQYSVIAWFSDGTIGQFVPESGESNRRWMIKSNIAVDDLLAIGISYEKICLGSWWKSDWYTSLTTTAVNNPQSTAEIIRWLHLPIQSQESIDSVRKIAHQHPSEFLAAWLKPFTMQTIFRSEEVDEFWLAAIRDIFINWTPTAKQVDVLIDNLSNAQEIDIRISELSWQLLKVDPRILHKILKVWVAYQENSSNAKRIIKNVYHQFAESNNENNFAIRRSYLIQEIASQMNVDIAFVMNGIVSKAIDSVQSRPIKKRDELNIALAIGSETMRRLLGITLLEKLV